MLKYTIIIFVVLIIVFSTNGQVNNCVSYENNIYQVTTTFPNYKSFYSMITLLPKGLSYEVISIAMGMNEAELGLNLKVSTLIGQYQCGNTSSVYLKSVGYLFKSDETAILPTMDRISRHDYYLNFSANDSTICTGQVTYTYFQTGSNPYISSNKPIFTFAHGNITCSLLPREHYTKLRNTTQT
ncbi:unnamed protein product [Adineta ricciae]|uniref:Uncharacterized protein n=1 Tax=Adineta ricciae TaxID=249248 RepID=A0A815K3E7_ADIRI|nr:unnamed protein product [Adineta ricciae]CAF1662912.1 unnamed protein product [Adineta ricciae]